MPEVDDIVFEDIGKAAGGVGEVFGRASSRRPGLSKNWTPASS
jgi:hypothetical protein